MKRNWWVIANAARARVLEETDQPGQFLHVADLVHPQSRLKGDQLGGDRPGHVEGNGHGLGSASFPPRTDPREREHERFSRDVAKALNDGVAQGRCAGFTLVASDPFLGQVKSHLSVQSKKLLLRTVPSDYTAVPDADIARRVRAAVAKPAPTP
jgi:protein required for attachment to host cells